MIHEALLSLIPNDPASVARATACLITGSVSYAAATRTFRRSNAVQEGPKPLADRIRARMAQQPEIVTISDNRVERIAAILAPMPAAEAARNTGTSSS